MGLSSVTICVCFVVSTGGRLFRQWLCHPLRSTERIKDRYVALQDLGTGAGVEIRGESSLVETCVHNRKA